MAITNKLITFKKLTSFEAQLAQGNILDTSIVFIKDAKKIWTKGTYFDCDAATLREEIIKNEEVVAAALNDLQENKASKTYVDEAVASAGGGSSESIYYLSFQDFMEESGVVTAEEYEKIKKCNTLMFQTFQNGNIVVSQSFINKIDTSIFGGNGMVFSSLTSGFETNDSPAVNQIITFVQNEDGSATWNSSAIDSYTFKTINGEEILGEGDITIENVTEETVSNWGFTKNAGTITEIKMNGTSKGTNGVVDLGSVGTLATVETQETIDSVDGFKTINGQSIIGSGNIEISGGTSGGNGAYSEVNHGTSDTTFTLTPNTFHVWDEVSSLTLTLGSETSGIANEFFFQFTSGATATTLMLPDDIKWANDNPPAITENMIYQVSILKGLASVLEFSNVSLGSFMVSSYQTWTYNFELGMTWEEWVNSEYNTSNYTVSNNRVWQSSSYYVTNVSPSDSIDNGNSYGLTYYD